MISDTLREQLQQIEHESQEEPGQAAGPLWELVRSLRTDPTLRAWASLESVPLVPALLPLKEAWELRLPLAVPAADEPGRLHPWGWIAWAWPSRHLLGLERFRPEDLTPGTTVDVKSSLDAQIAERIEGALARGEKPPAPEPIFTNLWTADTSSPGDTASEARQEPARRPDAERLSRALDECGRLIRSLGSDALLEEWRRLHRRRGQSHFTVAVAGAFGRGKSTLINRLLGENLIQAGPIPGPPTQVRVRAGEAGAPSSRSKREASRPEEGSSNTRNVARVDLEVDSQWLRESGIHLVDTPSADPPEVPETLVDTLSTADAVLLVVSANMAMGQAERIFVEQHVLSRHVPRIALVLSHLDSVAEGERARVLAFVREKALGWSAKIQVYCAHGPPVLPTGGPYDIEGGCQALRDQLSTWARDPQHQTRVETQLATNLETILRLARSATVSRIELASSAAHEREAVRSKALQTLDSEALDWGQLRVDLEERRAKTLVWLGHSLDQSRNQVLERLSMRLAKSANPKEWWTSDLPFHLGQEVEALGRSLESGLLQRLRTDQAWLTEEIQKRFDQSAKAQPSTGSFLPAGPELPAAAADLKDLTRLRWLLRGGTGLGTVLCLSLVGFAGAAIPTGGAILNEILMDRQIRRQRGSLEKALQQVLDPFFEERALPEARLRVEKSYRELRDEIHRLETLWREIRQEALENEALPTDPQEQSFEGNDLLLEIDQLATSLQPWTKQN